MSLYYALLVATILERAIEIAVSNSNARWSLERGGREVGRGHFPAMVALHSAFLAGCVLEPLLRGRTQLPVLWPVALAVAAACQALRWWCIVTLGRQWNTRVIVVPGLGRVARGPYRWLKHPNYVAVVCEGFALPAVGGAWLTAAAFTVGNALLLRARVKSEDAALRLLEPESGGQSARTNAGLGPARTNAGLGPAQTNARLGPAQTNAGLGPAQTNAGLGPAQKETPA
ncbi:MAG TPA: isoprenylcysteine carboxylmethyltransferase family protein [Candidatus Binatia bacterium]